MLNRLASQHIFRYCCCCEPTLYLRLRQERHVLKSVFQSRRHIWLWRKKELLISPRNESICQHESLLGFPKQLQRLQWQLVLCSPESPSLRSSHMHCSTQRGQESVWVSASINPGRPGLTSSLQVSITFMGLQLAAVVMSSQPITLSVTMAKKKQTKKKTTAFTMITAQKIWAGQVEVRRFFCSVLSPAEPDLLH